MKRKRRSKKGQIFNQIGALGIGVVSLAIVLVVALLIQAQVRTNMGTVSGIDVTNSTQCAADEGCAAMTTLQSATQSLPGWIPLVIIAVMGSILLGLVMLFKR